MDNVKRIVVFVIGTLLAIFLLEIGLRVGSFVHQKSAATSGQVVFKGHGNSYVILCLGNSYTKGVGAPPGNGYPEQLQRMLNKTVKDRHIVVINKGVSIQNTSELLGDLGDNLTKYQPDLIILQIGQANSWNYLRYTDYLKREDKERSFAKQLKYLVGDVLFQSRVYRLVLLLRDNIRHRREHGLSNDSPIDLRYRDEERYRRAKEFVTNTNSHFLIGKPIAVSRRECDEAIKVFLDGVKRDPEYLDNYYSISHVYRFQYNYEEAIKWCLNGLRVDSSYRVDDKINEGYIEIKNMRMINKGRHDEDLNKTIDAFINRFKQDYPDESLNFFFLDYSRIGQWVEADVKEIVRIIQQRKIRLVIQNYPIVAAPSNAILERVSGERRVPFVDNQKSFQKKLDDGLRWEDLFVPDRHCNARGYGVMAANVYNKIMEEGLLKVAR
ncbi:MAG: SGNH/GDSL hydrolase family protein [Deltaproteobacteria bacterium]|nr:SGNH/GDSL hydrolase family protein [Deltaproteobacteria bacterium]